MVATRRDDDLMELRDALAELPLRDGERGFAKAAAELLRREGNRLRLSSSHEPLSRAEAEALRSVGVRPAGGAVDPRPIARTAAAHAVLVGMAMPIAEAARMLGVSDARIRQRVGEGTLLAVRGPDGRSLRLPTFQFADSGELPGLRVVLRAIRVGIRPLQVAAFFTTPQADLEDDDGEPMTPVAWLSAGGDPEPVRELARSL
jgi:hypothetical protein